MDLFGEEQQEQAHDDGFHDLADVQIDDAPGLQPPQSSDILYGHEGVEKDILDLWHSGRMPHALVLNGLKGIGKSTFAYRLARFVLNESSGGESDGLFDNDTVKAENMTLSRDNATFQKVASGGHPDLKVVKPAFDEKKGEFKNIITRDDIRVIPQFFSKKASMGGWRVTIIDDANLMAGAGTSSASQNVLLKILEEPPKDALLILVTHGAGGLLPTIRSRCRFINFHPLSDDHVNDLLVKANGGVPLMPSDADILIALSQGSAGQAIQLFEQGGIEQIVTILDCLASLETANEDMLDRFALSFGKSGKTALDQFLFVLRWWFEMIVRMQINGQQTYTVGHIDITIPNHTQLADFLHLQENIEEHIKTCQSGNLDTRYMIFKILRMIQNG